MLKMMIEDLIRFTPLWAPEGEEGSGGDGGDTGDAGDAGGDSSGGDAGAGVAVDGGDAKDGDDNADTDDGGTAEGEDNTDGEDGDKSGDDTDDQDGDDAGEGDEDSGEGYDDFELPDGMEVDTELLEALAPQMKEAGLSQEQAQAMVSAYAEKVAERAEQDAAAINELWSGWLNTAKQDKEIGGDKFDTSVDNANAAVRELASKEFVDEVLVQQGLGNHPEMIRFLNRVASHVLEDQVITGEQTDTSDTVSAEEAWYGETTPKTKKG